MFQAQNMSITQYCSELNDPRTGNNIPHPLINIITLAICGVMGGADGWVVWAG